MRGEGGLACEAFETVSVIKGYTNNIDVKFIKGYLAIMFNNTDLFFAFCKVSFLQITRCKWTLVYLRNIILISDRKLM